MLSLLIALVAATTHAAPVDPDAATMTSMIADVAARADGVSVVTRADLAQLLEMEANQQLVGCDDAATSCMAEVAAALGAEIIVRGELGVVDDQRSLTLSVLNGSDLSTTARAFVRGRTLSALGDEAARVLPGLIVKVKSTTTSGKSTRVFVTDVVRTTIAGPHEPIVTDNTPVNWPLPLGVVTAAVGVVGLGAAGFTEWQLQRAKEALAATGDDRLTPAAAVAKQGEIATASTIGKVLWIAGAGLAVVGGVLIFVGVTE